MGNRLGTTTLLLLGGILVAGGVRADQVYRCQTENDVVYQDFPCEGEGEQVELPTDLPDPGEVKRLRRRQAEMRTQLEALERQRQREEAAQARRAPEVVIIQPPEEDEGDDGEDRAASVPCPLGLGNCARPAGQAFRRPAANRGETPSPLGLSNDSDGAPDDADGRNPSPLGLGNESSSAPIEPDGGGGEGGGTLAEP